MKTKWIIAASIIVAIAGIIVWILSKYVFINTKTSVVNHNRYLGNHTNPAGIYGQPGSGKFYSPLNARVAEMDKLLLVNMKDDPEYDGIELQTFDDARGQAARVLLYHHTGPADDYYSDAAFINEGEAIHTFVVPDMRYSFEVSTSGLNASLEMKDKNGKSIEFVLKEDEHTKWSKGFLAPVGGSDAVTFSHFPLFFLKNMNFMPQRGAAPLVKIGGDLRTPGKLPVPVDGELVYYARYTDSPIIGQWNRPYNGELPALQPDQQLAYHEGQTSYELVDNAGHFEIRKLTSRGERHQVILEFSPAIPDLPALKDGVQVSGRFSAGADEVLGIVAGTYHVIRRGQIIEMEILPLEGWQPFPGTIWVKTWAWKGTITSGSDGRVFLKSDWIREKPAN